MFNHDFCSSFEILFGAIVDFVLWSITEIFEKVIVTEQLLKIQTCQYRVCWITPPTRAETLSRKCDSRI